MSFRYPFHALLIITAMAVLLYTKPGYTANNGELKTSGTATKILVTFPEKKAFPKHRAGSGLKNYTNSRYRASPELRRTIKKIAKDYKLKQVSSWSIKPLNVYCVVYELNSANLLNQTLSDLNSDSRVEMAQVMQQFTTQASQNKLDYDDPYLKLQANWQRAELPKVHHSSTGKGIKLAIIDTAIETNHPDLKKSIIKSFSYIPASATKKQKQTHGTAMAGVIAAEAGNKMGIIGIAPDSQLISLAACWYEQAESSYAICNSFTLAQALSDAIEQNADIINLSLAGPDDPLLLRLIQKALSKNIIIIAAKGLSDQQNFPASVDGVIAAASTEIPDTSHTINAQRLVLAPGKNIISTAENKGYDFFSGNSIATAQVAGVLALIKQKHHRSNTTQKISSILASPNKPKHTTNICKLINSLLTPDSASDCQSSTQASHISLKH